MQGGYAVSVGERGYDNGVFFPYSVFFCIFVFSYLIFKNKPESLRGALNNYPVDKNFLRICSTLVLAINILILLSFLFVWGSYVMFISDVGRGEFRATLSGGVLYYWCMKIFSPGLFLYYTLVYLRATPRYLDRCFFKINIFVLLLIGLSTGFKSTFITLLLPVIFLYYWNSSFYYFFKVSLVAFLSLLLVYFVVSGSSGLSDLIDLMVQRVFIAQADVSWYLWGKYQNGEQFPSYFQSLLSIFGSKVVWFLAEVDRSNLSEWVYYDYNSLINILAGLPLRVVAEGHNVVGTVFSEALVAFGYYGLFIFPLVFGWFIAHIYNVIQKKFLKGHFVTATILLTYFSIFIISWLVGGGVSTIFHISLVVGFCVLFVLLNAIKFISLKIRFVYG